MSAILGRVNFDGAPIDTDDFGRAFNTLAQYGRDRGNIWLQGSVALGSHLLDVTPESQYETQPHERGSAVIVADARIDNRNELFNRLAIPSGLRPQIPDSDLILRAYHLWGHRCTKHLLGDFTFAIWSRSTRELFCARDHIGARPLYFSHTPAGFVFATDIRALERFRDVDTMIDEREVARYLIWNEASKATFFRSIFILQPAHQIIISSKHFRQEAYWTTEGAPEIRYRVPSDYIEHFRTLLDVAVADRVRTPHRIGAHLSGGLDSSGVAVLAQRQLVTRQRRLHMAYSWSPPRSEVYPSRQGDERDLIELLCAQEGIDWHYPDVTAHDFLEFLQRDMAAEGTPDVFEEIAVMRHAGRTGIRTMLSGWGGDEAATFSGQGYLAYLLKSGNLIRLIKIMRGDSRGLRNLIKVIAPLFFRSCVVPLLPDAWYYKLDPHYRTNHEQGFISSELENRHPTIRNARDQIGREVGDPRKIQSVLISSGHLARRMETWAHWSSAYKIVYSYPLTDRRILEFAMGLPREMLYQKGHWRYLFRAALNDVLPRELAWRRGKADPVNEAKRSHLWMACWKQLSNDLKTSCVKNGDAGWLNDTSYLRAMVTVPEIITPDQVKIFISLVSAARIRNMERARRPRVI